LKGGAVVTVGLLPRDLSRIMLPVTRVRSAYAKKEVDDFLVRAAESLGRLDAELERKGSPRVLRRDPGVQRFLPADL
jgi:hypothetical protein